MADPYGAVSPSSNTCSPCVYEIDGFNKEHHHREPHITQAGPRCSLRVISSLQVRFLQQAAPAVRFGGNGQRLLSDGDAASEKRMCLTACSNRIPRLLLSSKVDDIVLDDVTTVADVWEIRLQTCKTSLSCTRSSCQRPRHWQFAQHFVGGGCLLSLSMLLSECYPTRTDLQSC